jgi:hypothetical protein
MEPKTFHPFPRLPSELRHLIWQYSLPDPRWIEPVLRTQRPNWRWTPTPKQNSSTSPSDPIILQVCHESREFALKFYERKMHYKAPNAKFVNFETDIFRFSWHAFEDVARYQSGDWSISPIMEYRDEKNEPVWNISKADLARMRNLVLEIDGFFAQYDWQNDWIEKWIPMFGGLRCLVLESLPEARDWMRTFGGVRERAEMALRDIKEERARLGEEWEVPAFSLLDLKSGETR